MNAERLRWGLCCVTVFAWIAVHVVPAWTDPAFDLSALIVGSKVVTERGWSHLYEHDPIHYNLASSPAFTDAARALGFDETPTPFVHTPLLAVAGKPLAALPYTLVAHAWLVAAAIAMLGGLYAGARFFAPGVRGPLAAAVMVGALLSFEPIRYGFALGQTTPFIFALTMGALLAASRARPLTAGSLLALAAFVKLTPLAFAIAWIAAKRWKALAAMAAVFAALALLSIGVAGLAPHLEYVERVRDIGRSTVIAFNNHSLPAFVERFGRPNASLFTIIPVAPSTRVFVALAAVLMIALAAWSVRRVDTVHRERLVAASCAVFVLMIPTIAWTHYFVLLVPVGVAIWELAPSRPARGAVVAALLLCSRPLAMDHVKIERGPIGMIVGPTIAALLLYATVVLASRRLTHTGSSKPSVASARTASASTSAAGRTLESGGRKASAPQRGDGSHSDGSG